MNSTVRTILVVYLLCVALLCIYVPLGYLDKSAVYAISMFEYRWIWDAHGPTGLVPDIPRIALELVSLSTIAGAVVLLAWRRRPH